MVGVGNIMVITKGLREKVLAHIIFLLSLIPLSPFNYSLFKWDLASGRRGRMKEENEPRPQG